MNLLDPLFRAPAVDAVFSDRSTLQGMLDFEAALARAEARIGVIPQAAATAIAAKCRAELLDASGAVGAHPHTLDQLRRDRRQPRHSPETGL